MDGYASLDDWFVQSSRGFPPFAEVHAWLDDPELRDHLEAYRFGVLAAAIRDHRQGAPAPAPVAALIRLARTRHEARSYTVYRGLCLSALPQTGAIYSEASLNGWSLYPSIALRLALAQGSDGFVVLRQKLGPSDPALYIDEWEHELLRPPFTARIGRVHADFVTFLGMILKVAVVDLQGEDGNDIET